MRLRFFQFVLLLALFGFVPGVQAATFTVTKTADTNGTCSSGVDCSLREAITAANDEGTNPGADTINFAAGVTGTITLSTALPALSSNITLSGPGAASLTIARSNAGGTPNFSIFVVNSSRTVSLSGLTLSNGTGHGSSLDGGSIYNSGTLTVSSCVLSSNAAGPSGQGGAIYNSGGTLTITSSTLSGNSAPGGNGGGLYNSGGAAIITGSTFNNNTALNAGGAIRNSLFGNLTLDNSTLSGNLANNVGGGIYNDATLTVRNCTLISNRADADGNGPTSGTGGGLALPTGSATLNNSIVANNFTGTGTTRAEISGTISAANNNLIGNAASSGGIANGTNNNIVGVNGSGTRNINTILNTTLSSNGGPTQTHNLVGGSPAVNAGSNALIPPDSVDADGDSDTGEAAPFDQRGSGFPRIRFTTVDIGAVESGFTANESLIVTTLTDENDGTSDPAYGSGTSLREAITYANLKPGTDTITFQNGLNGTITLSTGLPNLDSNLTISGPGAANLSVVRSSTGGTPDFSFFIINNGKVVSLSGLTISNGIGNTGTGRPIFSNEGIVTVTSCVLSNNQVSSNGGAIYAAGGTMTLNSCVLSNNKATSYGGAIYATGGTLTINNSTLSGNTASHGGTLFNEAGATTINNSTLSGNSAVHGGGIYNYSGEITINNSTLGANTASGAGGAIRNSILTDGNLTLRNSTISCNSANTAGGGIYSDSTITVSNCTITGNRADASGTPSGNGGGLAVPVGTSTLNNSIVAGNFTGTGTTPNDISGTLTTANYNLISDANSSGGITDGTSGNIVGVNGSGTRDINTILNTTLADNGGPTKTHTLVINSPAFNAGDNALIPPDSVDADGDSNTGEAAPFDQRGPGFSRIRVNTVDIGAFEALYKGNESLIVTTLTDENDDTSDPTFGAGTSLREAIAYANLNPGDDTITFQNGLTGTITLNTALPDLSTNLTITGPGASSLTIARSSAGGTPNFSLFYVSGGNAVSLSGLTLSNGTGDTSGSLFRGGAIYNGGALTITGCVLSNNQVTSPNSSGGAIYHIGPSLTINNSTLSGNSASGFSSIGGAIFSGGGAVTINNSILSGNSAPDAASRGGAIAASGGAITINNSTLNNNQTNGTGGAIRVSSAGNVTLNNCTLSGNAALNEGGGIYSSGSSAVLTVNNCTITGNNTSSNASGGGLGKSSGSVTLNNSIVAGNLSGATSNDISGTINTANYNLIGDAASSGGIVDGTSGNIVGVNGSGTRDINTILNTTLSNNGGPTKTHNLVGASPAINAGSNALIPPDGGDADGDSNTGEAAPFDQRGPSFLRIEDGVVDIGAIEFPVPTLSVARPTVTEGNAGTKTLTFVVTLSTLPAQNVNFTYQTVNGTAPSATAGTDYVTIPATTGTIPVGQTSTNINVTVNSDTLDEFNENIGLLISNLSGALLGTVEEGIITDDDPTPTLSVNDVAINETNGGSAQAVFTVSLSAASEKPITVVATTNSGGGSPTATPDVDYLAQSNATITFAPGQTSRPFNVTILGDVIDEGDEKFAVSLSGAVNAILSDNTGVGTILDNDNPPTVSVSAPNVTEGNPAQGAPGTGSMTFTIKLSAPSARNISVQYQTANSTTLPATAGNDYVAVPLTTVIFLAGETTKTVNVTVNGDLLDEPNERIRLNLTNPFNATLGTISDGIIVDDDATPTLSINDLSVNEGNPAQGAPGTKMMIFTVTLSAASGQTVTVNAATGNGGTPAATAGSDYQTLAATPITFAPGQTTKQVVVTTYGDATVEPNEKFGVILSGAVNATLADNSAIGTILNDDAAELTAPSVGDSEG